MSAVVVCCLCLHATFKKPVLAGVDLTPRKGTEELTGIAYCKPVGPSVAFNPCSVRSCKQFIPAPNHVQRNQALQKLGGAFSFIPRKQHADRTA